MRRLVLLGLILLGVAHPESASAQSHWGVTASVTPRWTSLERPLDVLWDLRGGDRKGSEVTVGLARGSRRGGDWSVSFVKKRTRDGGPLTTVGACEPQPCQGTTRIQQFSDVSHTGVEFAWSPTFVTIADRLQIGATVGGGIATTDGTVQETLVFPPIVVQLPGQPPRVFPIPDETQVLPASEAIRGRVPLARAEVHANVLLARGLKLRVAGGLNAPGIGVRAGLVYLFGE